jgi:YD repeat-containing protein
MQKRSGRLWWLEPFGRDQTHNWWRTLFLAACLLTLREQALAFDGCTFPAPPSSLNDCNDQIDPPKKDATDGDPVVLYTGNLHIEQTDLTIAGRGMDFKFTRTYRNGTSVASTLGVKWDFNWNQFIVVEYGRRRRITYPGPLNLTGGLGPPGPGERAFVVGAFYFNGSLRIDRFEPDTSVTRWKSPEGYFAKLLHEGPSEVHLIPPTVLTMRSVEGTVYTFGLREDWFTSMKGFLYRLTRIEDRQGNVFQLLYEPIPQAPNHNRLKTVVDTFGREIQFSYDQSGWLTAVNDFEGRSVTFAHDQYGNLTDVTSPAVVGTPTGNDFPLGKSVHYEYGDPASQRHSLERIFDAQEWQNGTAQSPVPYLYNTYDSSSRVVHQVFGGTNASGIPAGGHYAFIYQTYSTPVNMGWFQQKARTLVVDPNGNVRLVRFDVSGSERLTSQYTGRFDP